MKIKVINKKLSHFNEELKVTKLNYDMVAAVKDDIKLNFSKNDVEFIAENEYEDALLEYEDVLKIKLNRGISKEFYIVLIERIEEIIDTKVEAIDLLQDDFRIIKKGLWEKHLLLVVNHKVVLEINVTANNYSNIFNFIITDVALREFVAECAFQVDALEKELKEKQRQISAYRKAVETVVSNYGNSKDSVFMLNC
jgi:hypothetical protein